MDPFPRPPHIPADDEALFVLDASTRHAIIDARLIFWMLHEGTPELIASAMELAGPVDPDDPNDYDLAADTLRTLDALCDRIEKVNAPNLKAIRRWHEECKAWEERNGPLRERPVT